MGFLRLAGALLAVLLLMVPAASAAEGEGLLRVEGAATLPQGTLVGADDVALALSAIPDTLDIRAERAHVERWVYADASTAGTVPLLSADATQRVEESDHAAVSLVLENAGSAPVVVLEASRLDGAIGGQTGLHPVSGVRLFSVLDEADSNECTTDAPCVGRHGTYRLTGGELDTTLAGDLHLYLYDVDLVLRDGAGEHRYASGSTDGQTPVQKEIAYLKITLTGAVATLATTEAADVYAPQLLLQTGEARFPAATGSLDIGVRTYRAANDDFRAAGSLVLEPRPVEAGRWGADGAPAPAAGFETSVRGDVTAINLAAVPIYQDSPAETAGLLTVLVAGFAALGYFWPTVHFQTTALLAPLYSRLKPPKLLDNDVRNGIYQVIRENPGISARGVHRKSDQSWGTVVYHLRQLEAHHLVVSRRFGRARSFYENHGKYKGMERQLAVLRSPRARAVARCILEHPALTQEELSTAAHLAQPTTSYYVRKLVHAELVGQIREGRYVRYQPQGDMARFLDIAERTQPAADSEAAAPA